MINRIRDIRRQKGMTLADVAAACEPATTAQTIGRLETGMRNLSLIWMNRIAAALDVEPELLVRGGFSRLFNRDVLAPRPGGRFAFGRMIDGTLDANPMRIALLPPGAGQRQIIIDNPPWLAVAEMLARKL